MSSPLVACLTVTNRPHWRKFVEHQVDKQAGCSSRTHLVVENPPTIAAGRTLLLKQARELRAKYVAWFDDDDWANPFRLTFALNRFALSPDICAFGNVRSFFVSTATRRGLEYHAPEGIIFNGAVFELACVPEAFDEALVVGEDTAWLDRWMASLPSYYVNGIPMHAWLCHGENVTNRASARTFEQSLPFVISDDDWRLVP